jgi:hypothetical protein
MIDTRITWHEIKQPSGDLPDANIDVLVYDGELDDTVIAYVDMVDDEVEWFDAQTGEALPRPLMWAQKPYPVAAHHARTE